MDSGNVHVGSGRVVVSGLIGAGKTTLVRAIAAGIRGIPLVERPQENPYFTAFYADPPRWAFRHYLFFFEQSVSDANRALGAGVSVQERLPAEHLEVFGREFHARGFLADSDIALLGRLSATCDQLLGPPDIHLHIDVSADEALYRIRGRDRREEEGITVDYLQALAGRYDGFLDSRGHPVVRIDAADYDFRRGEDVRRLLSSLGLAGESAEKVRPAARPARGGQDDARA